VTAREDARPLRTVLFCAGDQPADIERGWRSGADAIVVDLEEPRTPCPESVREEARAVARSFMASLGEAGQRKAGRGGVGPGEAGPGEASPGGAGPLVFARVQPPSTGQTLKDLRAVMSPRLAGILVPKIQGPGDIHAADAVLTCMEAEAGLPLGSVMLYPILETAQALRLAYDIATASPRVSYMGGAVSRFGDIHQALGFRWTAEGRETLFLRSKVLIDAKAAGIRYPISGMWGGDRDDEAGLRAWCTELRNLGYYGMMIGDPSYVPVVHELFSPTAEEIAYWQDLDRLAAEAERAGSDRITYGDPNQGEGHVVHIAHVGSARLNLEWARALGLA
jgi:citrate lyase subunit beta / citryl-CoA lyase